MKSYHHSENIGLVVEENPHLFKLYDLMDAQKMLYFNFLPEDKIKIAINQVPTTQDFTSMILSCSITALIAPRKTIAHYFETCHQFIIDPQTTHDVEKIMDQWAMGFVGVWDYDFNQKDQQLLLIASDTLDFDDLFTKEDKKQFLYTQHKMLSHDWSKLNTTDLVNYKKEAVYKDGEGKFLLDAIHNLDKNTYYIKKEQQELEAKVLVASPSNTKNKL